jgi:hypothetical protein
MIRRKKMSTPDLAAVIALLDRLSPEDKQQLIEHVARDLRQKSQSTLHLSWKDARGLGKEEGVDVDRYIDGLRNEWDR